MVVDDIVHGADLGGELQPLGIGLDLLLGFLVKALAGEGAVLLVEVGVRLGDVRDPVVVGVLDALIVDYHIQALVIQADVGGQHLGHLLGGDGEGHGLELVDGQLLLHIEDGAGVVKVKHHIGAALGVAGGGLAIGVHEVVDGLLHKGIPVVPLNVGRRGRGIRCGLRRGLRRGFRRGLGGRLRGGLRGGLGCGLAVGDLELLAHIDPVGVLDDILVGLVDLAPPAAIAQLLLGDAPQAVALLHRVGGGKGGNRQGQGQHKGQKYGTEPLTFFHHIIIHLS